MKHAGRSITKKSAVKNDFSTDKCSQQTFNTAQHQEGEKVAITSKQEGNRTLEEIANLDHHTSPSNRKCEKTWGKITFLAPVETTPTSLINPFTSLEKFDRMYLHLKNALFVPLSNHRIRHQFSTNSPWQIALHIFLLQYQK